MFKLVSSPDAAQMMWLFVACLIVLGIALRRAYPGGQSSGEEPGLPEGEGRLYIRLPKNSAPPEIEPVAGTQIINYFTQVPPGLQPAEPGLKLFSRGELQSVKNVLKDISGVPGALYFNYDYTVVMQGGSSNYPFTVGFYKVADLGLPEFELHPEGSLDRLGNLFNDKDINSEWDPAFSKRYYLSGPDKAAVAKLFTTDIMGVFDSLDGQWYAQGARNCVIVFKQGFLSAGDYTRFMSGATSIFRAITNRG